MIWRTYGRYSYNGVDLLDAAPRQIGHKVLLEALVARRHVRCLPEMPGFD
jgi:hypothetical protein